MSEERTGNTMHLDDDQLVAAAQVLGADALAALEHLSGCLECRGSLTAITLAMSTLRPDLNQTLGTGAVEPAAAPGVDPALEPDFIAQLVEEGLITSTHWARDRPSIAVNGWVLDGFSVVFALGTGFFLAMLGSGTVPGSGATLLPGLLTALAAGLVPVASQLRRARERR